MHVHLVPGPRVVGHQRVGHGGRVVVGQLEVSAHDERLDARIARATRLGDDHVAKEYLELGNEQRRVLAAEYLPNERAARLEQVSGDVHGGQQQLRLHILVQVVESGDVRRAVKHDQVHQLAAVELGEYFFGGALLSDVALQLRDAGQRGH